MYNKHSNNVILYNNNNVLFVKTHHYSYKQLIVHGKVYHNILTKNEIVCNQYV